MKKLLYNFPVLPFVVLAGALLWRSVTGKEMMMTAIIAILGVLFAYIAFSVILIAKRPQRLMNNSRRWQILVGVLCLAVCVSVPLTEWPLRVAYQISRPQLDRVARELQAGKSFPDSMWVGVIRIKQAKVEEGNGLICLWTHFGSSGRTGFVLHPPGKIRLNLAGQIELDDRWQFISED